MTHEDGTMDVEVGGEIQRRPYRLEPELYGFNCQGQVRPHTFRAVPETGPDELLVETIGSLVPKIVRIR